MDRFSKHWADSLNFLLGAALFLSPSLVGFNDVSPAAANAYAVGLIIAVMALSALFAYEPWEEWVSAVLGVWLIVAPWMLGFTAHGTAMLTHVLIGIGAVALAMFARNEHYWGHTPTER